MDETAHCVPDTRDVIAAKAGDDEAFARIYDRHAPVVLSLCRRRGDSGSDAEDATQETFMRAHRRLDQIRDASGLRCWLYAIARNVLAERARAARRRNAYEAASLPRDAGEALPAGDDAERREALDQLTLALDRLDERERIAVHLQHHESDPARAAADALGLSRSAYYKLLARARSRLACLMQEVMTP